MEAHLTPGEDPLSAIINVDKPCKTFVTAEKQRGLGGSLRSLVRPVRREVQAVKNITFAVEEGERVAARLVFRRGLRRYESGNRVVLRG